MRHPLVLPLSAFLLASIFGSGCSTGDGQRSRDIRRDPTQTYPATGETKRFALTIEEDVPWEVGPSAIYDAITYNRTDPKTGQFPDGGTYRGGHQYMHTINGKAYEDAIEPFQAKVGELVRWRIVSIGLEFHTWHIHGHRWIDSNGTLTDNIALGPGMYSTFEFLEDNPGDGLVHCHVPTHTEGGMLARYLVE